MNHQPNQKPQDYWAFVSYSSKDRKWGEWLHRRLENYPIPAEFRGMEIFAGAVFGKNLRPVFRDRDDAWRSLLRWKLSDPTSRTISFHSRTTAPEHIEREITWAISHLDDTKQAPNILTDAYDLDPGHPLIHLALAAIEENEVSREFLKNYGLKRLAAAEAISDKAAHQAFAGTYRAKAAIILFLQGDQARSAQVFAALLAKHDPHRQTWASPAWIEKLDDFEWPKTFRLNLFVLLIDNDLAFKNYETAFKHQTRLVELRRGMEEPLELAEVLFVQGQLAGQLNRYDEEFAAFSESLAIASKAGDVNPAWLSDANSALCWSATLTGKHAEALAAGEKAVSLLDHDKPHPARMNLAHGYLFNGQFEKAKAIYAKHLGTALDDGRKWNDELRNDINLLREAGHDHPDMKKIEALLE
jgi:tetratricopeptide (TPR) repeat protein